MSMEHFDSTVLSMKSAKWSAIASICSLVVVVLVIVYTLLISRAGNDTRETSLRGQLYDNLISSGKVGIEEIGTKEDFLNAVHDERTSREFYRNLSNSGLFDEKEIGTENEFYDSIKDDFK